MRNKFKITDFILVFVSLLILVTCLLIWNHEQKAIRPSPYVTGYNEGYSGMKKYLESPYQKVFKEGQNKALEEHDRIELATK